MEGPFGQMLRIGNNEEICSIFYLSLEKKLRISSRCSVCGKLWNAPVQEKTVYIPISRRHFAGHHDPNFAHVQDKCLYSTVFDTHTFHECEYNENTKYCQ